MKRIFFTLYLIIGLISMLMFSCSKKMHHMTSGEDIVIYPPPPNTTRIQYLKSISSSMDVTGNRSAFARFIMGDFEDLDIRKPYGIAIQNGKLYICDTGLDAIEIIDLENNTFEYFNPTGRGQLKKPVNCHLDEQGNLYVADVERRQVIIFDPSGKYIQSLGEKEDFKPTDVFVKGDKIWVANFIKNKLHVYSKETYELLFTLPDSESGNEDFLYSPSNIYVSEDKVYVSDFGDFKIKVYTLDGEFIMSVGSFGDKIGQFVRPKGVAVDKESNLYVVDAGFENTQIFNKDGDLLMFFGGPYQKPGDMYLPAKVIIDYNNLKYFEDYVDESFNLIYLIFVTNQYGPDKISVYGYVEAK